MMKLFPNARFLVAALLVAVSAGFAVDGIAISTHRLNDNDISCGFGTDIIGKIVRHDIRASVVVKDTVIYDGGSRCAVINQAGSQVAFVKNQGRISVINIDGTGFKELTSAQNSSGSWIDWPAGDWVYYFQKTIGPPDGGFNNYGGAMEAKNLRRVNVTSGADEAVAEFSAQTWQFGMEANATKSGGLLVMSGPLVGENGIWVNVFDIANPKDTIRRHPGCSPGVSPTGQYYMHNSHSHKDMFVYNRAGTKVANIYMNEYAASGTSDGAEANGGWTRNRWSANSDKWVMAPHSKNGLCATEKTDMVLYNWADKEQIYVTRNTSGSDEPMDFWVTAKFSSMAVAPAHIARGPVLQGLQLRLPGSGVYAIDIFTPRGARAGSFQLKAPGAFDLFKAGLSNGLYQIRVRAGADIFWFKAPVVR